jgi:outer membrane lipoprotein
MKRVALIAMAMMFLAACTPQILSHDLMKQGAWEFSLADLWKTPEEFEGKLFILGGVIYETKFLEQGSQIEAIYVPVNSYGYLKTEKQWEGKFIAAYPKSKGILDPFIYNRGKEITLAGVFVGLRKSKIDEREYVYPVFDIKEIYLWDWEKEYYLGPSSYPYYPYPGPYLNYPWWWKRPHPGPDQPPSK